MGTQKDRVQRASGPLDSTQRLLEEGAPGEGVGLLCPLPCNPPMRLSGIHCCSCNVLFNEPINASVSARSESCCSTLMKNPGRGCGNPHSQLPGQKHRWDSVGLGSAVHGEGGECLGD